MQGGPTILQGRRRRRNEDTEEKERRRAKKYSTIPQIVRTDVLVRSNTPYANADIDGSALAARGGRGRRDQESWSARCGRRARRPLRSEGRGCFFLPWSSPGTPFLQELDSHFYIFSHFSFLVSHASFLIPVCPPAPPLTPVSQCPARPADVRHAAFQRYLSLESCRLSLFPFFWDIIFIGFILRFPPIFLVTAACLPPSLFLLVFDVPPQNQ